ncbi:asparagine synthase (glutamine-hydrolyzing) [Streptomyces sp. NBC_01275]|uniref:asparagine synthase (glutamine-hydrolyzing) n=1 Tax=Streptomyces sp. NBC_01275 TaxID=2903807 RepID=UPI0022545CFB|nr:asparagine synthase (glutamine-hydrolyzing) [Streptomyces sp. NBC_01275]MCX4767700.1 asparagine synthase (glutamine-hydrolyzing) [Streptomyces sp. NBC_01275]
MCGLVGYAGFAGGAPRGTADTSLKAMTETLACRGPDASAVWAEQAAGLGHTRLAVVDLIGGRQPLLLERDGSTVLAVAFTGEVYNHARLRTELAALGHRFSTRGDSEVVLRAVDAWGEQAPSRLEGMFAYVAWEPGPRRLTLVRDRFGIKPLCYAHLDDAVVFASEPKAVLAHPAVTARLDLDGLRELLLSAHPMIKTPGRSAFAGLREVAPGTVVTMTPQGVRARRYWSLDPAEHGDDLPATVARVRRLLEESVTGQLTADVPVSVLLSGGLDSSAIAALARPAAGTLRTLSVDLGERASGQDAMRRDPDGPYADLMAAHLGSAHRRVRLDADALADPARRAHVGRLRDGLTLGDFDTSLLELYRAVREHFPVTLAGDGADELFGGYRWFTPEAAAAESFPWDHVLERADLTRLLDPTLAAALDLPAHRAALHRAACAEIEHLPGTAPAEAALRRDSHLNLTRFLPCLLDRADRLGMGVGLEVRVPFLDHRLVEYVFNIPWAMKTFDGREKSLLRAAVADLLPASVLARRKSPYPMVRDPAYRAALTAQVARLLDDGSPAVDLLDTAAVRRLLLEPTGGRRFPREGLELVLDLDQWLRTHRPALHL